MDHQEQAFLTAALSVGDERLERRLLVGFYLIRDCCRLADDPTWVPRVEVAREVMDDAITDGTFTPGDLELLALTALLEALESEAPDRSEVYSALVVYATALFREGSFSAVAPVFEILDVLWTPACKARDRLEAMFYQGLVLVRSGQLKGASEQLPVLMALRARAAREYEFIALAGVVRHNRTFVLGNLPSAISEGEKRLRQLRHHPSPRAEGLILGSLAAAHGRAGHFDQVLRCAKRMLDRRYHFTVWLSAYQLSGVALTELGELDAARPAFELLLLAPTAQFRRVGWRGLMDLHARRGERPEFEHIYNRLVNQPCAVDARVHFWQVAGRGWAKIGDLTKARAAFDEAMALARRSGYGYEIIETEDLIDDLPDPDQVARAADIAPEIAAYLTELRDEHADEIAACMA